MIIYIPWFYIPTWWGPIDGNISPGDFSGPPDFNIGGGGDGV